MPKVSNQTKREAKKFKDCEEKPTNVVAYEAKKNPLKPINESQRHFISSLTADNIVIGAGKAGTGKTYLSARVAAKLYAENKMIEQIILTRPNVEVGPKMGFLPGDIDEKYEPYIVPFRKGLKDQIGLKFDNDLGKKILAKPLAYMRGETFDNTIMLLDEAQNTTVTEMKMFITRIGINSKMFITGDEDQSDIRGQNGLQWLMSEIKRQQKPYDIIRFNADDCVRSDECKDMLNLIENEE